MLLDHLSKNNGLADFSSLKITCSCSLSDFILKIAHVCRVGLVESLFNTNLQIYIFILSLELIVESNFYFILIRMYI